MDRTQTGRSSVAVAEAIKALQNKNKAYKQQVEELVEKMRLIQLKNAQEVDTLIAQFKQKETQYTQQIDELQRLLERYSSKVLELQREIQNILSSQQQNKEIHHHQRKYHNLSMNGESFSKQKQNQHEQDTSMTNQGSTEIAKDCDKLLNIIKQIDFKKFTKLEKQNKKLLKENQQLKQRTSRYQNQVQQFEKNKQFLIEEVSQLQQKKSFLKKQNEKAVHLMTDIVGVNETLFESLKKITTPNARLKHQQNTQLNEITIDQQLQDINLKIEQENKKYQELLDKTGTAQSVSSIQSLREKLVKSANKIEKLNKQLLKLKQSQQLSIMKTNN